LLPSKFGGEIPSRLIISPPSQLVKIHGKELVGEFFYIFGHTHTLLEKYLDSVTLSHIYRERE